MVDWGKLAPKKTKSNNNKVSIEKMARINIPRNDGLLPLHFRPIYKPYLFFQYWNEDDVDNIRYGQNYYAHSSYFGSNDVRLRELGYPTSCPNKLCMSTVVSMLILDRGDGLMKVLELPWNLFFEMSRYASIDGRNLGGKTGVDWSIRKKENGSFLISTGGIETPFTDDEKSVIMNLLKDDGEALSDFYARRVIDIEDIIQGLNIDPQDVYKEPVKKVVETLTIPKMEFDKYFGKDIDMSCIELSVLKNLRTLADSKEYDRHLSREMSTQETINMDIFKIESHAEVAKREFGMPLSEGLIKLLKSKYESTVKAAVEFVEDDDNYKLVME